MLNKRYLAAYLFFLISLLAIVAVDLYQSFQKNEEKAQSVASNASSLITATLSLQLGATEKTARSIASFIPDEAMRPDKLPPDLAKRYKSEITNTLRAYVQSFELDTSIQIFNAQGSLLYTSNKNTQSINISSRDYFREMQANPKRDTYYTNVVKSMLTGEPSVYYAHAISDPDHNFLGIVSIKLDPKIIRNFQDNLSLGERSFIALRGLSQGELIARIPEDTQQDQSVRPESADRLLAIADKQTGVYFYTSPVDGVDRLISYQRIGNLPFYIEVGISRNYYVSQWLSASLSSSATLLFLVLLLSLFFYYLLKTNTQQIAQDKKIRLLLDEQNRLLSYGLVGIMKTRESIILWENHTGQSMFGYKNGETLGQSVESRYKNGASYFHSVNNIGVEKNNHVYRGEHECARKDGTTIWVDVSGVSSTTNPEEIYWFYQDITERKNTQHILETTADELSEAQKIAEFGNYNIDLRAQTWRGSVMMDQLLGIDESDPHTVKSWLARIHLEDIDGFLEFWKSLLNGKTNGTFNREYRVIRKSDGKVRWLHGKGVFLFDQDGNAIALKETVQDITKLKRAEAQQLEMLRASKEATEAKNIFVANVSHEIRTPLNGILGMAHALQHDGIEIAETKTYAKTILQSGETLLTLLNDILDLAALESHKASLLNIDFRLLDILNPVKDLFTFNTNNQTLIVESIDSKLCDARYRGDPIRIRQMLSNFVHNAIKFAPQGDIRIGCQEVESDGSHALIEFFVLDQGEGIPAEKLKVIFDPFTQITNNSTNTSGGTGLGLAIVRDLAHLMGGDAGCESSQFFGSRFYFRVRLPIVVQPIPLTNESDQSTKIPVSKDMTGTVLIADDNKINRIVIETLLLQQGITTFSVVNGKQALEYIESGARPSLILMDCQMPVMDGYDATGQIRLWESANQQLRVPIVALTAAAFNYDRQRCTDAGMDDYLSKPISLTALHEVLTRWIGTEKIQAN